MKCKIFNIIYNLLPFPFLRVLIIDNHFSRCKNCSEKLELDEIIIKTESFKKIDIWEPLKERISLIHKNHERLIKKFQLVFAISLLIVLIGFFFMTYMSTKKTIEKNLKGKKEESYAIVENAFIRGKRAKIYIFKPKEKSVSIIWLEPEREVNYK